MNICSNGKVSTELENKKFYNAKKNSLTDKWHEKQMASSTSKEVNQMLNFYCLTKSPW